MVARLAARDHWSLRHVRPTASVMYINLERHVRSLPSADIQSGADQGQHLSDSVHAYLFNRMQSQTTTRHPHNRSCLLMLHPNEAQALIRQKDRLLCSVVLAGTHILSTTTIRDLSLSIPQIQALSSGKIAYYNANGCTISPWHRLADPTPRASSFSSAAHLQLSLLGIDASSSPGWLESDVLSGLETCSAPS